ERAIRGGGRSAPVSYARNAALRNAGTVVCGTHRALAQRDPSGQPAGRSGAATAALRAERCARLVGDRETGWARRGTLPRRAGAAGRDGRGPHRSTSAAGRPGIAG